MKAKLLSGVFGMALICASGTGAEALGIKELYLVHFSHTDVGFTDHPAVCRELYRRYLDVAIDTVLDTSKGPNKFCWTAEATMPVNDWWQQADASRRKDFLKAVRTGQLEISALACNNTPFMNAAQWQTMVHWLPEDVWRQVKPRTAIQNDVNGVPRAAALALLDRGVKYLFTGINEDNGGAPFKRPSAFWWRMPDGRRMFVWLNGGYGEGFAFFEQGEWRRGPVPRASDARYRPPRAGDILAADEASLREAQRRCAQRLRSIERGGYTNSILTISITSQWRYDNDPPFPPLADFVGAWNKLGLEPKLRLVTVSQAMERLEKEMGAAAPEYTGEWTDWWANGTASGPREVVASRVAKRYLAAAESALWGKLNESARKSIDVCYKELCLFDEHTWGSSLSVARPYNLDTIGQFTEKSALAYRPMARAEWILSQRARTALVNKGDGLYVANAGQAPYTGWVRMLATSLRENYQSVKDPKTGLLMPLSFEPGIQPWGRPEKPEDLTREDISATFSDNAPRHLAKFWVENLLGIQRWELSKEPAPHRATPEREPPQLKTDAQGWPVSLQWPGMKAPLFLEGFGDFSAVKVNGFAPRWALRDIHTSRDQAREKLRREKLEEVMAVGEAVSRSETEHTIILTQPFKHPRLVWGTRVLEIWKAEPRVKLTVRVNRSSSAAPEIFYIAFPLPTGEQLPQVSSGGQAFTPFTDQLPGTCRDYFAVDGWAHYATAQGDWLWVSRDAPLISFGTLPAMARRNQPPKDVNRLLAMVYNNFWYTNFAADENGIMEFEFDLVWKTKLNTPIADLAESLVTEPVVLIEPALKDDGRVMERIYRP